MVFIRWNLMSVSVACRMLRHWPWRGEVEEAIVERICGGDYYREQALQLQLLQLLQKGWTCYNPFFKTL